MKYHLLRVPLLVPNRTDRGLRPSFFGSLLASLAPMVPIVLGAGALTLSALHGPKKASELASRVAHEYEVELRGAPILPLLNALPFFHEETSSRPGEEREKEQVAYIADLISDHRPNSNSRRIAKDIVEASKRRQADPFLIAALISVESSFKESAVSRRGAQGLMQLLPATARYISKREQPNVLHRQTNLDLGIKYLRKLEDRYRGNRLLALAAYNWGPGKVDRVKGDIDKMPKSVRSYAKKVLERNLSWARDYERQNAQRPMVLASNEGAGS